MEGWREDGEDREDREGGGGWSGMFYGIRGGLQVRAPGGGGGRVTAGPPLHFPLAYRFIKSRLDPLKTPSSSRRDFLRWSLPAAGIMAFPPGLRAAAPEPPLRSTLERLYIQWLQAMVQKDITRWAAATSRYRQMCLRNQVVSLKQPWPRAIFQSFFRPPDLLKLQFVDASASGAAARLVYFGRVDFGFTEGEVTPENPLILHFLKEDGSWKFNTLQYVNLGHDDVLKREIRAGGRAWLERDDFRLDPAPPEMPRPCPEPYQVATLSVAAAGCRAEIEVNGGPHRETVENTSADHVIIGGLRKGANKVTVRPTLSPIGHPGPPRLEITVIARTGNPARPTARLLSWKIPAGTWKESYDLSVWLKSAASLSGP